MDVVSLSFVYPRGQDTDAAAHDAVAAVAVQAMSLHPSCMIAASPAEAGGGYSFLVTGPQAHALAAKGVILRECPVQTRLSIKVPRSEILDFLPSLPAPSLKPQVRRRLDDIASQTLAHIAVVNPSSPLPPPMDVMARNTSSSPFPSLFAPLHSNGLETEPLCQLVITGTADSVDVAKVRLLVMLDELSGLHSEAVDIDHKLHPIVAARKRTVIQAIQEETATNIYFPTPLRDLIGGPPAPAPTQHGAAARMNRNVIWITGEFFGVQRARDMLFQSAHTKSKQVISRDAAILPRKIDWMLSERLEELKAIMSDNATFLDFPPLGSQSSVVGVYGDNRVNIQRSVRAIMLLATQFHTAQFYLLPTHFNLLLPPSTINANQITPILTRLSAIAGGAEVVFKDNCFEVFGLENEARRGIMAIGELPIVKTFHQEIRFQLELANEHRDFISGKKNGKINKVMQVTNCKIRFETLTATAATPPSPTNSGSYQQDHSGMGGGNNGSTQAVSSNSSHGAASGMPTSVNIPAPPLPSSSTAPTNFLISISGTLHEALQGLTMLLEELPAEISFYVPESYHKRIIGVGGRNIQRIMKRWGVFVKFFNGGDEWASGPGGSPAPSTDINNNAAGNGGGGSPPGSSNSALPGTNGVAPSGGLDAEDNVVARTPAKNAMNLENLKAAVLELVHPKDKDFTHETVAIPRRYHRTLLGEKNIFIKDIESKTGSKVRFPDKETASDVVTIYGPESQVHIAAARLLDHVPFEADMTVPSQPDLARLCASPEFAAFTERMKREYQVSIIANVTSPRANNKKSISTLSSVSSSGEDSGVANGNGTSVSAVPSFKFMCQRSNMDFLAPAREALETFLNTHGAVINYGFGQGPSVGNVGVSVGNPVSGVGHVGSGNSGGVGVGVSLAVGPNGMKHKRADSFADAFPHFNSKILATPNSEASGFLHRRLRLANSTPDVKALFHSSSVAASASSSQVYKLPEHDEQDDAGFEAPVQQGNEYYPPRIRHAPSISYIAPIRNSEDALKRGSDSLLEAKLKQQQLGKPRSLTNRAQSLDLTSLSRSGSANTIRAASPEDYAAPPSPTSATASSFPSVNGQSMNGYGAPIHRPQQQQHHYTHQNHYSFPNATYTHPSYHHQHHLSYSRPRTHVSLSTSSSSLSLASAAGTLEHQQPTTNSTLNLDGDSSDQSVMDEVSRVISQIRLDSLH